MRVSDSRLAFIDALKAIASQLIVLHHLAFYGPMSDVANELAPALFAWLSQDARIAVQIFLVAGGFLAARALAPTGSLIARNPLVLLKNRYFKLATPYIAAIILSILCAAVARRLMEHHSIPNPPSLRQVLAHIALLQNILAYDALSAGIWYIAIDFQLFALLLGVLWLARAASVRSAALPIFSVLLVSGLALVSLFYFNRDSNWDSWAIYFFGTYAMGVLTYWATESERKPDWLPVISGVVIAALVVDFRSRIAVALLTALTLGVSRRWGFIADRPKAKLLAYLGKISYSVFLAHFPVLLVVNAIFSRFVPNHAVANACGIVLAWVASNLAGILFYRLFESRSSAWLASVQITMRQILGRLIPAIRVKS